MRFPAGRTVLYRNVRFGRLGWVRPARVIGDDERGLLLWLARGTPVADEVAEDGRSLRAMPFDEWIKLSYRLRVVSWHGPALLMFLPVGAAHSVWWFRDPVTDQFANWYVNLEAPGVRWDDGAVAGVDVIDQDLDVVIGPDRSWFWKDEDEFTERLAYPEHYWVPDPEAVRAEGERVAKLAEVGEFPFDRTWCDFQPDPDWPTPAELPAGWNRPAVR